MQEDLEQEVETPVDHNIILVQGWHYSVKQNILGHSDGRRRIILKYCQRISFYTEGIQCATTLFCIWTDTGNLRGSILFSILRIIFLRFQGWKARKWERSTSLHGGLKQKARLSTRWVWREKVTRLFHFCKGAPITAVIILAGHSILCYRQTCTISVADRNQKWGVKLPHGSWGSRRRSSEKLRLLASQSIPFNPMNGIYFSHISFIHSAFNNYLWRAY